jgi:hypothetical protein
MSIEDLNYSKVFSKVKSRFDSLTKNSEDLPSHMSFPSDIRFVDVLVIGSLANGEFIEGNSDLDLVVLVDSSESVGNFPMLTYERKFNSGVPWSDIGNESGLDLSEKPVDLAIYRVKELDSRIKDDKVFSLKEERFVSTSYY